MRIDLIVASRNGATRLDVNLARYPIESLSAHAVGLILVDSASDDGTLDVMRRFAADSPLDVVVVRVEQPGLALAQNKGLEASRADLVVFTDDDCSPDTAYMDRLRERFSPDRFHFGSGEITPVDGNADPRVANTLWWNHEQELILPPHSLLVPGQIQGANMFFRRDVLDRIGGMIALGPTQNSDLMTAYCASAAGYTGVMLRGPVIRHDHGRVRGSATADAVERRYATVRGCYFARLMARGDPRVFDLWKAITNHGASPDLARLEVELQAAAHELKAMREGAGRG